MEESKLPKDILIKASVSPGGEHAWKKEDIPSVLEAAKKVSLVCVGGQPQFQGPIGIAEPYWLNYEPSERKVGETWESYVIRSNNETLKAFQKVCNETDFIKEAMNWDHIKKAVENGGINPVEHLWFILYFNQKECLPGVPGERQGRSGLAGSINVAVIKNITVQWRPWRLPELVVGRLEKT